MNGFRLLIFDEKSGVVAVVCSLSGSNVENLGELLIF
jgi:hypothetical protein